MEGEVKSIDNDHDNEEERRHSLAGRSAHATAYIFDSAAAESPTALTVL
jgi:hypothetical protein